MGGTNSIVASSPSSSSGTRWTGRWGTGITGAGGRERSVGRIGGTTREHFVAALSTRPSIHRHSTENAEPRCSEREERAVRAGAAFWDRRRHDLGRVGERHDVSADGQSVVLGEGFEHDSVDGRIRSIVSEGATTFRPERTDVAAEVPQLESGDDDLEPARLGIARIDAARREDEIDPQAQLAESGIREEVLDHVAMLAREGAVGVADADARVFTEVLDVEIIRRVR